MRSKARIPLFPQILTGLKISGEGEAIGDGVDQKPNEQISDLHQAFFYGILAFLNLLSFLDIKSHNFLGRGGFFFNPPQSEISQLKKISKNPLPLPAFPLRKNAYHIITYQSL